MKLFRLAAVLVGLVFGVTPVLADGYPLTLENKFGTTRIERQPQRVVSLSYAGVDNILALGVRPIAIREWYGNYPYAVWPWAQAALGDAKPVVLKGDLNIEQIAALEPDVIMAVGSGITQQEYDLLSQIAPVVATEAQYPDYGTPMQVDVLTDGKVLGKSAEAEALLKSIEDRYAAVRAAHPDWQGKSAAVGFFWNNAPGPTGRSTPAPACSPSSGSRPPPPSMPWASRTSSSSACRARTSRYSIAMSWSGSRTATWFRPWRCDQRSEPMPRVAKSSPTRF